MAQQFASKENTAAKQSTANASRAFELLGGPQLGADRGFESCDDFAGVFGDLHISQSSFAALESYSYHQGIFADRNIFAPEQVAGFDRINLWNIQGANCFSDFRECRAFSQQQRKSRSTAGKRGSDR